VPSGTADLSADQASTSSAASFMPALRALSTRMARARRRSLVGEIASRSAVARATDRPREKNDVVVDCRILRGLVKRTVLHSRHTQTDDTNEPSNSSGTIAQVACRNVAKKKPIHVMKP
jgi:hypothetical protein